MTRYIPYHLTLSLFILLNCACTSGTDKKSDVGSSASQDSTAVETELSFDSSSLQKIIEANQYSDSISNPLKRFYGDRDYKFAWITKAGLTEQAANFWNAQNNYISYTRDSSIYNLPLQQMMDTLAVGGYVSDSNQLQTEIGLTTQFFRYARRAYQGNIRLGDHDLDWFIPRKRINMTELLDSLIRNKGRNLEAYEPVNKQYRLLKEKLLNYYQLADKGGWPAIELTSKKLQTGDTNVAVIAIKKRLHTTGDFPSADTSSVFTDTLSSSVKNFQTRYGLKTDGIIGGSTLDHLNEPVEKLIRQILVNMERMRWIPVEPAGDFVLVNIPQFRLIAYENGKRSFAMNIVAGSSQNQTVVFTGDLKFVVFSPYWNVPPGILKKEILPGIKRDPRYLARHNMEWHGNTVRQKPGPNNSLGKVKFLFPNNYNIYLHDTPAKSLFDEPKRAFSHGCIRLEKPGKLAEWVLRKQPEWTPEKIHKAMNAGKEKFVLLKTPIPVFLGYFTAWVDEEGKINFRDDIYGHDKQLADRLFAGK